MPSPANNFSPSDGWVYVPQDVLIGYRGDFVSRHEALMAEYPQFDFTADFSPIDVDVTFFNDLIQNAEPGHYLAVQYTCTTDLSKMGIALCIKEKGGGPGGDDRIVGHTYSPAGDQLSYYNDFIPGLYNYLRRKVQIFHVLPGSPTSESYNPDREGRVHKITENMKESVQELADSGKNLYAYFILDDVNIPEVKQLSVAFTDYLLDETSASKAAASPTDDGKAYDHGSACCPIP